MRNLGSFFLLSIISYSLWFTSPLKAQLASGSKIVFELTIGGNGEIFVIEEIKGKIKLRNLTNHPADDYHPTWSPDGKRIAFVSNRDGGREIFIMDADGKNPVKLTKGGTNYLYPSWSPSGRDIAFMKQEGYIYILDKEGRNERKLTEGGMPAWSNDGKKIAFMRNMGRFPNDTEIFVIEVSGGNVVRLTDNLVTDWFPSWSPDGGKIAFFSERNGVFNYKIYIMNADGGNQRKLTAVDEPNIGETSACWSPDGNFLAFFRERGIYIIRPDGTDERKLLELPSNPLFGRISWFDPAFVRAILPKGKLITTWGWVKRK